MQVYEAASRAADAGGWVTLGLAALTGLDQLDLAHAVRSAGFPVLEVSTTDTVSGRTNSFARSEPGHRWSSTHIWRRDLLALLRERLDESGIDCHYGFRVDPCAVDDHDVLVGADGARSLTRRSLGNQREPAYTGQQIRYGHYRKPIPGLPTRILHFWTDPEGVVGYVGDDRDGSFWFSRRNVSTPTTTLDRERFFGPLHETRIGSIIDDSEVSTSVALYELDPDGTWHNDNTVLIGDAAHAVSPAAGRGATSAIEDAITLAKTLREADSVAAGLDSYTAVRRPVAQATYRPGEGRRAQAATAADLRL
ncbi:FAD-dependent oxidoreductase [Nocardia carnea]|uniref:FAD-dependent oxidoreductase n=1 Tax=Nocardia carnea TaxID=37328 RepID=UPI0024578047|nr:NAD(P)/FAD-dependent oxidoreductase [Nocardia carnea]